jgi:hypothetical protein
MPESARADGHAEITRPISVGSAAATRLARLPATNSAHGSTPPFRPDRESASKVVDAATIIPSTDKGRERRDSARLPVPGHRYVQLGDRACDQRK